MTFSSRDFPLVKDELTPVLPDRLIHKAVAETARDAAFSSLRRHPVALVDLPSKTLSVTFGALTPGQVSGRHRHNYETIIYVLTGAGTTIIEDRSIEWSAGDAIYIPIWAWHHHRNASDQDECTYLACENAPLLQNLGGIALREEAGQGRAQ